MMNIEYNRYPLNRVGVGVTIVKEGDRIIAFDDYNWKKIDEGGSASVVVNSAIQYLLNNGGGVLKFKSVKPSEKSVYDSGQYQTYVDYVFDTPITVQIKPNASVSIEGNGVWIAFPNLGTDDIAINVEKDPYNGFSPPCYIKNLGIYGRGEGYGTAIRLKDTWNKVLIENVNVRNFNRAFHLYGSCYTNKLNRTFAMRCIEGIVLDGSAGYEPNGVIIDHFDGPYPSTANRDNAYGIKHLRGENVVITNCWLEGMGTGVYTIKYITRISDCLISASGSDPTCVLSDTGNSYLYIVNSLLQCNPIGSGVKRINSSYLNLFMTNNRLYLARINMTTSSNYMWISNNYISVGNSYGEAIKGGGCDIFFVANNLIFGMGESGYAINMYAPGGSIIGNIIYGSIKVTGSTYGNIRIIGNRIVSTNIDVAIDTDVGAIVYGNVVPSGKTINSGYALWDNYGYRRRTITTVTFSGNGSQTTFSFAHGLNETPTKIIATPMTADAAGDFYCYADATNIYIVYKTAPPAGTNNVKLSVYAER